MEAEQNCVMVDVDWHSNGEFCQNGYRDVRREKELRAACSRKE